MPVTKRIICLAASHKSRGLCIAGKEIGADGVATWIRPVSARSTEELQAKECRCGEDGIPRLRDIIEVPLLKPRPHAHQEENWSVDLTRSWAKVGRASQQDLESLLDPAEPLWINGDSSSNGTNDRVSERLAYFLESSLRLIPVDKVVIYVDSEHGDLPDPTATVRAGFRYLGDSYDLSVTHPRCKEHFRKKGPGRYSVLDCILTISLGEPFHGHCYKLAAAIMKRSQTGMT